MHRLTVIGAAGACLLAMGITKQTGLAGRVATVEDSLRRTLPATARASDVEALEAALAALRTDVPSADVVEELRRELAALENQLEAARAEVERQASRVEELQGLAQKVARIDEVEEGARTRWNGLVHALEATTNIALETQTELGRVRSHIAVDNDDRWRAMVGPTVQLAGDTTVGSGVILPSRPRARDEGGFETVLLTAYHVVRDIRADARDADAPIPVFLRSEGGDKTELGARLLAFDVDLDAALLVIETDEPFAVGALLPTRERLRAARVFDPIVAVGCPLGNDPIPTLGQLTDLHHRVGDERFWMISAPTYIGNSGGGLYAQSTHELVGIFSKIYTHGAIRPTVIPHMGLVTPLESLYDWIDAGDVARVVEAEGGAVAIVLRD